MSREVWAREVSAHGWTEQARELCRAHGLDPRDVGWAQYDVIDIPLVRFGVFDTDDEGAHFLACEHGSDEKHDDDCRIAITTVERAAVGDLPSWLTDPS